VWKVDPMLKGEGTVVKGWVMCYAKFQDLEHWPEKWEIMMIIQTEGQLALHRVYIYTNSPIAQPVP
jgi:hypothetical protein